MGNVKVIIVGLGAMGAGMARMILNKKGIEIVGAVNRRSHVGEDLSVALGTEEKLGVTISNDFEKVVKETEADIVLLNIDSFVKSVFPYIKTIVENKKNVITIAEEMAYPKTIDENLTKEMDELAKANGVSILGTGVNPGFVLDTLVLTLSAATRSIKTIKAARINDLSPFGTTVMLTQGVGTTPEQFQKGIEEGTIVGHIGFLQSVPMVAETLGIEIDEIKETREPIISKVYRETPYVKVEPGMVAGCRHIAYGYKNGEVVITMEHPQQIHPHLEGVSTGDYIDIVGDPNLSLKITPETPGGIGTMTLAVNMIPQVIAASAGLKTMVDLPVPHGIENSFADQVKYYLDIK